jgi:hypothetical protein
MKEDLRYRLGAPNRRGIPRVIFAVMLLLFSTFSMIQPQSTVRAATRYVFAAFRNSSQSLSIYTSLDGLNFTLLSHTGYTGPSGVLRDPTIMKHTDGRYYVAYTINTWTVETSQFGIAYSTNLTQWTHLMNVNAGVSGVRFTWAPEWFKDSDGSINLLVNIGTGSNVTFRTYKYTATNSSLTSWSAPTAIGIGPNYIDTFIVKSGSTYHAFPKNETTKYIEHATATNLAGPWTWVGTGNWAGWGSGKEGPALYQLDNGQWRMLLDCYTGCGYLYTTTSNLNSWPGTSTLPGGLSGTVRHGTVLRETDFNPTMITVNDNTTGTGNNQFQYTGTWSYGSQNGAYQNDNHWSSAVNANYQVRFNGRQIRLYGAKANNHGIAAVRIDNGAEVNVDFYAATRSDNTLLWTSPMLAVGQHTLRVRVTGTRNPSSSGNPITADRVDITP